MTFIVNELDMTPYIEYQGLKWQRNDVEGSNAGRMMNADMQRDRIATKARLDCTCIPLRKADAQRVLNAIYPEYVTVTYDDPQMGLRTCTMYSNNVPATYCMLKDGVDWWMGIAFPLIER